MSKVEEYKVQLCNLKEWDDFLLKNSNLPSPRSNLELLVAAVEVGTKDKFLKFLAWNVEIAPVNHPGEFLCTIGVTGLGKLISDRDEEDKWVLNLKAYSADPRWRVREGVAMALQYIGKRDMNFLLDLIQTWTSSDMFVQRALVAGLCEPVLLKKPEHALQVIDILHKITVDIKSHTSDRKTEAFRVLKKALSYGWSVAIIFSPTKGREYFEELMTDPDIDVRGILKGNLGKNRLKKMDAEWVKQLLRQF